MGEKGGNDQPPDRDQNALHRKEWELPVPIPDPLGPSSVANMTLIHHLVHQTIGWEAVNLREAPSWSARQSVATLVSLLVPVARWSAISLQRIFLFFFLFFYLFHHDNHYFSRTLGNGH